MDKYEKSRQEGVRPVRFFVVYITVLNITKKVLFAIVQCIKLGKWVFGDINEKG